MPALHRRAKEIARQSLHALFIGGQHFGIDILPRHFYSEIPDFRELRKDDAWKHPRSMYGVNGADVDQQLAFVRDCVNDSARTLMREENIYESACRENGEAGFGPVEAEFLFCFVARHRPQRVIQVGAGVSTAVLLHASRICNYHPAVTCIDPLPRKYLKESSRHGRITLIARKAQEVDPSLFAELGPGDLLFVDSTHAVRPGSEVNILILEVLPRLQRGCHVHFHDIYFPFDYPPCLLTTTFFPNESALLHAFLTGNASYSITASLSMLHHLRPRELRLLLPNYRPRAFESGLWAGPQAGHFPSSAYLRKVG